ncbi:MAG: hypothetical protein RLZZ241_770 [Bacteroidota bacterium]|jgi:hypothetical protein
MKKALLVFGFSTLLFLSCGGDGDGGNGGDGGTKPPPTPAPQAATLIFPENNSTCVEGTVLGPNDNQLTFQWSEGQNADSYTLVVKNLSTLVETQKESNTNSTSILLKRGTPYQWYVVSKSKSTTTTANSSIWKFFNAGEGIINYAPFPADAIYPARGAKIQNAGTLTLEWAGSDVDDDLTGFEVYVDSSSEFNVEPISSEAQTLDITVESGLTYYWKVVSFDSAGNSSISEVFEFSVN